MAGISVREQALYAAVEATPGTAETLAGTDVLQVMNLQPNPVENIRLLERQIIRSSLNPEQAVYGGALFSFQFDVELKGSGSAGSAPRLGRLLRACGMDETIVASTSVTYTPSSDMANHDTVTIGYREGPNYRVVKGCRGNVTFNLTAGEYGVLSFRMVGKIHSESEASAPVPVFETTIPRAFLGATFSIGGTSIPIEALTFDLQNNIAIAPDPNQTDGFGEIRITERNTQGTVNPEAQKISTKDFIALLRSGTTQAIQTGTIGSTAGNRWAIAVPKAYFREIGYGEREGLLTKEITFGCVEDSGDDEISIQFT